MSVSEFLNDCPFCGGHAFRSFQVGRRGGFGWVECEVCGARTKTAAVHGDPDEDEGFWEQDAYVRLSRLWNKRNYE